MAPNSDDRVIRLGPLAVRILARRRRWLRWAAIALLALACWSAISHARRGNAARSAATPVLIARRPVRSGRVLAPADLQVVWRSGAGERAVPPARLAGAVGQVALRSFEPGEPVAPEDLVPAVRYYGIAARVPSGMRAVSLVVPSAATFAGELAPRSRVDLIGAFEPARGQGVATLLATGVVLRVTAASAPSRVVLSASTGSGGGAPAQIEIAIPSDREREIVLAEAFGRIFITAHPLGAEPPSAQDGGPVALGSYLRLMPEAPPAVPRASAGPRPGAVRAAAVSPPPRALQISGVRAPAAPPAAWTVDVIEGDHRFGAIVPGPNGAAAPRRVDAPLGGTR